MAGMQDLPLFLLNTVLFPDDRLPLRVFEPRYMDMVTGCLKSAQPFGVCLLRSGAEVGAAGEPMSVGTLAHIERWEMAEPGVLQILVRGGERFEIQSHYQRARLARAAVTPWPLEPPTPIAAEHAPLARLLQKILSDYGPGLIASPHHFNDATWVGMRLAQLLPVASSEKQRWLELRDPGTRLSHIQAALPALAAEECES